MEADVLVRAEARERRGEFVSKVGCTMFASGDVQLLKGGRCASGIRSKSAEARVGR